MRYANGILHFLARHERHWSLHLFTVVINEKLQKLIPQRRIDIDLTHLRFAGENFQMEVLPGEQGWLFAIRRPYLIHLHYNGKDGKRFTQLDKLHLLFRVHCSSKIIITYDETLCGFDLSCLYYG